MTVIAVSPTGFREVFSSLGAYEQSWMWSLSKRRYWGSGRPRECFICCDSEVDLHHRTYERLGHEQVDDLVPLCEVHHYEVEKSIRKYGASRWDAHLEWDKAHREVPGEGIEEMVVGWMRLAWPEVFDNEMGDCQ